MQALDTTIQVSPGGKMSDAGKRRIAGHLRAITAPLDVDDGPIDIRVQIGSPKRTTAQNRLLWEVYARISETYRKAGRQFAPDTIHLYLKGAVLPLVADEYEIETGERLDVEDFHEMPNGRTVRTLTTTGLTKPAFSLYLRRCEEHLIDMGLSLDLSDLLDEAGRTREGKGTEPSHLAAVTYDELGNPLSDEPFASPPAPGDEPAPGPLHEGEEMTETVTMTHAEYLAHISGHFG